jgi:SAM-dependent methyltransferase
MARARYQTSYRYKDRETKAQYVWLKYREILEGKRILDVGADKGYLRQHLDTASTYLGVGLGDGPDRKVDLESGRLPFEDNSFDCVLCLDVLEHLEKIHAIFDELCRVTKAYVIISLPNPLGTLYTLLQQGDYRPGEFMKFYGLPLDPPPDRHRWFFSYEDAEKFVIHRAGVNGMRVIQVDPEWVNKRKSFWKELAQVILLRRDLNQKNLHWGPLWAVLQKAV